MSAKTFDLICAPHLSAILVCALRDYVAIEYPPGVGDCALVAREALLDVAARIESGCAQQARVTLSRRLRSLMKVALNFYCDQRATTSGVEQARPLLLQSLQGEAVDDRCLAALSPRA